jgi:hypothetical protein
MIRMILAPLVGIGLNDFWYMACICVSKSWLRILDALQ